MGILNIFRRSSDQADEIREDYSTLLGGFNVGSGGAGSVGVLEQMAEKLSTVVACTNLISGTISKLPITMVDENGLSIPDYRLELLNGECNPYMLGSQLLENLVKDYLFYGSAYALKSTNGNTITALTYVHPNNVTLNVGFLGREPKATYTINLYDQSFDVDPDELLIFVRQSDDGLAGRGVLHYGSNVIGQGNNEQNKSSEFFKNGALPTGVLKSQNKLSDASLKRLRESWNKLFTGFGNAGKTVILEEGLEYQSISFNPETLQLLNSKGFTVAEICRLFNVPQQLVDASVKGSYNSLEQQNLHYLHYTISPIINKLVKSLNKCLLLETEKDLLSFEIDTDAILMSSIEDRYKAHEIAMKYGVKSVNETRKDEGLTPLKGGDIRFIPLNMAIMGDNGEIVVPNYIHTETDKKVDEKEEVDEKVDENPTQDDDLKGGEDDGV